MLHAGAFPFGKQVVDRQLVKIYWHRVSGRCGKSDLIPVSRALTSNRSSTVRSLFFLMIIGAGGFQARTAASLMHKTFWSFFTEFTGSFSALRGSWSIHHEVNTKHGGYGMKRHLKVGLSLWACLVGTFFSVSAWALEFRSLGDLVNLQTTDVAVNERFCPDSPAQTVEIREADPAVDKAHHDLMRNLLIQSVATPNTTVELGPNVVIDFSDAPDEDLPLRFAPCVSLISVTSFRPDVFTPRVLDRADQRIEMELTTQSDFHKPPLLAHRFDERIERPGSARTPISLGPLLKFGPHRSDDRKVFLEIRCRPGDTPSDNVRISGFRIYGPSFGQQSDDDIGIQIRRCLNIEISNMEIAGWGGQGIQVVDDPEQGPGQVPPNNNPGERIGRPDQIRIFNNYIHHNQHPAEGIGGHAAGYGVEVDHGAWAEVYQNLFDFNRHAIAAEGDTGGYDARRNLVLKGGGYHYAGYHTHQFDIHGLGDNGFGGQAGNKFWYNANSFQYLAGPAIKIRGRPFTEINIWDNVFAHEGFEDDWGDDAVHVLDRSDLDVIHLGPNNVINVDSYGDYGVCDFDGDGVDDLFLATGKTWWYSSMGEFPWSYLNLRIERLDQVRLGYFDNDKRCDVLTQSGDQWVISSGGTGPWTSIGAFGAPLSQVAFGRFDPSIRDHRPGITRQTTHAFWRTSSGEWLVSPLSSPDWQLAQSSSFPMSKLRFGDFTGDGVTDVLAVQGGRWSISESGVSGWRTLNPWLSDDVGSLLIADLNNNNIDDLIKMEIARYTSDYGDASNYWYMQETVTWWVSDDGRMPWRKLTSYPLTSFGIAPVKLLSLRGYAGRFGAAPGGGVLMIDHDRLGRFYSEAEIPTGASPAWTSLFHY